VWRYTLHFPRTYFGHGLLVLETPTANKKKRFQTAECANSATTNFSSAARDCAAAGPATREVPQPVVALRVYCKLRGQDPRTALKEFEQNGAAFRVMRLPGQGIRDTCVRFLTRATTLALVVLHCVNAGSTQVSGTDMAARTIGDLNRSAFGPALHCLRVLVFVFMSCSLSP